MCIDLKDVFICLSINDVVKLFHKDDTVAKYVITYARPIENSTPVQSPVKLLTDNIFEVIFLNTILLSILHFFQFYPGLLRGDLKYVHQVQVLVNF